MAAGYTKLFASIVHSTIWRAPDHVRLTWITMLAMADRQGVIEASVPGLADAARVTVEECVEALAHLAAPDEWSRTPDHEGRRIESVEGGWRILNHGLYRDRMAADVVRQQVAARVARYRERQRNADVTAVTRGNARKRQAEASSDPTSTSPTPTKEPTPTPLAPRTRRVGALNGKVAGFAECMAHWSRGHEDAFGHQPPIDAAEGKALRTILTLKRPADIPTAHWPEGVRDLIDAYLADRSAFVASQGHLLRHLAGRVHKYLGAIGRPWETAGKATGHGEAETPASVEPRASGDKP